MADYDIELLYQNIRRALWATKAPHVYVSIRADAKAHEADMPQEVLERFADADFKMHQYSEALIAYPNGVGHRDDISWLGVWVSIGPFAHNAEGDTVVDVRVFANHLVNFQREYTWQSTPEGWTQTGKITARVRDL